jgi:transposase
VRELAHILSAEECATRVHSIRQRKKSPADLTDEPWAILAPLSPPAKQSHRGGRPRTVTMREGRHTLCSLNRSGGPWDRLPHAWLPQSTVYDYCAQGRDDGTWTNLGQALRAQTRVPAGRAPTPRAICSEGPAVKPPERGGPAHGEDGGQKITGRKRHLWGETRGVLRAVLLTRAGRDAGVAAPRLLGHVTPHALPRRVTILAEPKDPNHALGAWRAEHRAGGRSESLARPEGAPGCAPLAQRWVMERTNAWPVAGTVGTARTRSARQHPGRL